MSLLSVTVRKARFIGSQATAVQWNSYVTLKLQNVKSTTVTVKGSTPSWEQDFLFEINNLDTGLLIEVWNKGLLWDKVVGYHWFHLKDIHHSNGGNYDQEGAGQWLGLEAELVMQNGEVVGTKGQTGQFILVDARFELPYAAEIEGDDQLQHKLEMLNSMLDQEARADQVRRQQQYYVQSGVSEDSDYTSDINYPIGQHPNSSASQFLSAAHQLATPQRSLNSSRENSYEKDDDYRNTQPSYAPLPTSAHRPRRLPHPQSHGRPSSTLPHNPALQSDDLQSVDNYHRRSQLHASQQYWEEPRDSETDPLYYNSRPQSYKPRSSYYRHDSWNEGYSSYSAPDSYATQYGDDYDDAQDYSQPSHNYAKRIKNNRRGAHSLERQDTLYHDEDALDFQHTLLDPNQVYQQEMGISKRHDHFPPSATEGAVYDQYSKNYDHYNQIEGSYSVCDDTLPPDPSLTSAEHLVQDASHTYLQNWDPPAPDQMPHSTSTSKPRKELPKIPVDKIPPLPHDSVTPLVASAHPSFTDSNALPQDESMYHNGSYYIDDAISTAVIPSHSHSVALMDVTTKGQDQTSQYNQPHQYDTETHTETDWDYGGYYDETGNYIAYDTNSYYDESGNLVYPADQYEYYNQTELSGSQEQPIQLTQATDHLLDPQRPTSTLSASQAPTADHADFPNPGNCSQEIQDYNYDYYNYDDTTMMESGEINDPYADYDNNKTSLVTDNKEKQLQSTNNKNKNVGELAKKGTQLQKLQSQSSVEYNYAYESAENLTAFSNDTNTKSAALTERSNSVSRRASFRRQASTRDYALDVQTPVPMKSLSFDHEDKSYSNKPLIETVQTYKNGITVTVQDSVDLGYSISIDDEQYKEYGAWAEGYGETDHEYPQKPDFHQGSYDFQSTDMTGDIRDTTATGPVHMDSLESNASDAATRDPEANDNFEAQYWQKQKERIEKIQEAYTYDSYNSSVEKSKPTFFEPMDSPGLNKPPIIPEMSTSPRRQSNEDWASTSGSKKNSLEIERDEWVAGLDRKGSQRSIKSSANVPVVLNRKDSILDSHAEEDDEYFIGDETDLDNLAQRQHRHPSVESAGLSSPTRKLATLNDIMEAAILESPDRKSSLDIPGKDKTLKNVSFDEDAPQPIIPERVTKGMTPREKWLWAMNRICAQLVVSGVIPI